MEETRRKLRRFRTDSEKSLDATFAMGEGSALHAARNESLFGVATASYGVGLGILGKQITALPMGVGVTLFLLFLAVALVTLCNHLIGNAILGISITLKQMKEKISALDETDPGEKVFVLLEVNETALALRKELPSSMQCISDEIAKLFDGATIINRLGSMIMAQNYLLLLQFILIGTSLGVLLFSIAH